MTARAVCLGAKHIACGYIIFDRRVHTSQHNMYGAIKHQTRQTTQIPEVKRDRRVQHGVVEVVNGCWRGCTMIPIEIGIVSKMIDCHSTDGGNVTRHVVVGRDLSVEHSGHPLDEPCRWWTSECTTDSILFRLSRRVISMCVMAFAVLTMDCSPRCMENAT